MLNSDLPPAAPQGGRELTTDKTRVVSTRRRIPTNWFSGRTLQPSFESVVANSFVPSDFLVDDHVSGLETVHPLLTFSLFSTWILSLQLVFFPLLFCVQSPLAMELWMTEADHNPIKISYNTKTKFRLIQHRRSYTNYRKADWQGFTNSIENALTDTTDVADVHKSNKILTLLLLDADKHYIPKGKIRPNNPLLPENIRAQIKERDIIKANDTTD